MVWRKSPQALVALFSEAIPTDDRIEHRKMFGYPAAFINGNLFAGLHQDDFIVRLNAAAQKKMQEQYPVRLFEPMPGRFMREYVALPADILVHPPLLRSWVARSIQYVEQLPVKVKKASKPSSTGTKPHRKRRANAGR